MNIEKMRDFYTRHKPYSLQDYTKDAEQLIFNRINYHKYDHESLVPDPSYLHDTMAVMDPQHAAQWSALSRKRKAGLMLVVLYTLAIEYELDMTATLAHRMLQGLFDCSTSNKTLIAAFGEHGRTAADKSEDWERIGTIIAKKRPWAMKKLNQNRARVRKNKDMAWDLVNQHFKKVRAKKESPYK